MVTKAPYGLRTEQRGIHTDWEVYCHAHSKGVRVLPTVDGGGDPAKVMNVTDPSSRAAWVVKTTATMVALGLDDAIFDLEWMENQQGSMGMSAILAQTTASFHAVQLRSLVEVWTDTNSSDVMLNGYIYDMPAIGRSVDFIALMAYGMTQCACGDAMCKVSTCSPDKGCRCTKPGANSDLHYVERFVDAYQTRVDASKLVVVWPVYGIQFTCAAGTSGKTCVSPAWYSALSYHAAEALLASVTANQSLIEESTFDAGSSSQFFRWHDPAAVAACQVWWGDAHSIGIKCAWARCAGVRGVGFYQGTGAYPDNTNGSMAAMYYAIRQNFLGYHAS
jgi:spore germination protein YaaH